LSPAGGSRRKARRRGLPWPAVLAAAALGALHTPAYVVTQAWPLAVLCVAGLVALLERQTSAGRAALLGWAFGTAWLGASVWWLFISMHRYGGLPAPLAGLVVLALAAALSLYLALACALWVRFKRPSQQAWRCAGLFAALWLLAELARGLLFTGFPWAAFGYAQVDAPLAGLAPWLGVYGIGALAALAAARLGLMLGPADAARLPSLVVLAAAGLACWALARSPLNEFSHSSARVPVTLLQTNVAQDRKFAADAMPQALAWLAQALREAPKGLVVAPETAVPLLPSQLEELAPRLWSGLERHFRSEGRAALIGLPLGDFELGYTNSVAGLSLAHEPGRFWRYDKHHLVPFGEFIPSGFRWFTQMMNIPLGDFARGPVAAESFAFAGQRFGVNICYEDLFGEELAQRFADARTAPTVLVNISNIGWFGETVAIRQHLNITRMRTLELQRPMVRATNTGATAIVNHQGRVLAQMRPFERGALHGEVEGRSGLTPYARWAAAWGLWPLIAAAAVACVLLASRQR
jgi:apolipoprotein N-acyltransferase